MSGNFLACLPEIILCLQSHPHLGARAYFSFENNGESGGYPTFAIDDLVDFAMRAPTTIRQIRLVQAHFSHIDFGEHFAGVQG